MAVYKDNATGTWRVIYRFTNWKGERKQTQKRGICTHGHCIPNIPVIIGRQPSLKAAN